MALDPKQERRDLLSRGVGMLTTLDYCREKTGDTFLGKHVERMLLNAALADIEHQTRLDEIDQIVNEKVRKLKQ